jgi:hypothetical protein
MPFDQIEIATTEAVSVLESWGLRRNDHVLFICAMSEYLQLYPWQRAAAEIGAVFSCADAAAYDAARTAMFLEDFDPRLVIGLSDAIVGELARLRPDARDLLSRPAGLLSRPTAVQPLRELGVQSGIWMPAGPGVLVECRERAGAHVIPSTLLGPFSDGPLTISDSGSVWSVAEASVRPFQPCACGCPANRVTLSRES